MNNSKLVEMALEARQNAYAPYSNFKVGAALLSKSGKVYSGCNIENISFSSTICAERTAFFNAISNGEKEFEKIAIVGGLCDVLTDYTMPCGVCRQVMVEFCDIDNFEIIVGIALDDFKTYKLKDLLPKSFSPKNQKLI